MKYRVLIPKMDNGLSEDYECVVEAESNSQAFIRGMKDARDNGVKLPEFVWVSVEIIEDGVNLKTDSNETD